MDALLSDTERMTFSNLAFESNTAAVSFEYDNNSGTYLPFSGTTIVGQSFIGGETAATLVNTLGARNNRRYMINATTTFNTVGVSDTHYYFADQLGTASLVADGNGTVESRFESDPYGVDVSDSNGDANHYKFTGKERDNESNLDYFGARYYASGLGRWMSPDYSETPEPIPFGNLEDPQSLNLYSYVRNNPMSSADPDGHSDDDGCSGQGDLDTVCIAAAEGGGGAGASKSTRKPLHKSPCGPACLAETERGKQNDTPQNGGSRTGGPKKPTGTVNCQVNYFVMQGNRKTIGKKGAFPGFKIQANSAALDPGQFGFANGPEMAAAIGDNISGSVTFSHLTRVGNKMLPRPYTFNFANVRDAIGASKNGLPSGALAGENVRQALERLNPHSVLLELPGLPVPQGGPGSGNLVVPQGVKCPTT